MNKYNDEDFELLFFAENEFEIIQIERWSSNYYKRIINKHTKLQITLKHIGEVRQLPKLKKEKEYWLEPLPKFKLEV